MMSTRSVPSSPARRAISRIGGQGALLVAGFAGAQGCSFLRNALLGHWLSQGDFGIAAAITLMLQLVDTLSDIGADRLLIQAPDGDEPRLQATAHVTLIARGAATSVLLLLAAAPTTSFFGIPEATWAFELISLAPVIKGFIHLDARRYQRSLRNRPQVMIELLPQLAALLLAIPALFITPDYSVVVWLALLQAAIALVVSHTMSERPYRVALDAGDLRRLVRFGWPIWLSAFPLVAVYQGDRMIVGGLLGIEDLAAYTTAFMITMVPGLVAARVGNALMLPLLSEVRAHPLQFRQRYRIMFELIAILATTYLAFFVAAGDSLLPIVFGQNYLGLGAIVACLAGMWAMRMLQSVPGMALMAKGDTRPLLWAGLVRAAGLPLAILAVHLGFGLFGAAAAGLAAEALSLVYIVARTSRHASVGWPLSATCMAMLLGAATCGSLIAISLEGMEPGRLLVAVMATMFVLAAGLLAMPSSRQIMFERHSWRALLSAGAKAKGRDANAPA